jgi:MtN3 and saliva related transmembrane protein
MEIITFLGLLAACLTTFAAVPQLIKSLRTKHTKDISLLMYLMTDLGILLWLIYGIIIKDIPLIFANTLGLIITSSVLALKLKYK